MAGWNPTARPEALPKVSGPQGNPGGSPAGTPGGPAAATSAKGWAAKNRTTLLAAGAGGVVLLALVMKSKAGASSDDSAAAAGTLTTNPQNLAAYDSSSSDAYNAIQPQLEQLQNLFDEWKTGKDAATTVPVSSTPTTTPTTSVPVSGAPVGVQVVAAPTSGPNAPFTNTVTTSSSGAVSGSSQIANYGGYTFNYSPAVSTSFLQQELADSKKIADYGGKAAKEAALAAALAARGA